jgi:hypothetical protein
LQLHKIQQRENHSPFIPDDGRKAETYGKFKAYGIFIQIIVLKESNNKNDLGNHICFLHHKKSKCNKYMVLII